MIIIKTAGQCNDPLLQPQTNKNWKLVKVYLKSTFTRKYILEAEKEILLIQLWINVNCPLCNNLWCLFWTIYINTCFAILLKCLHNCEFTWIVILLFCCTACWMEVTRTVKSFHNSKTWSHFKAKSNCFR